MDASSVSNEVSSIQWTEYGIPIRNIWHMLYYAWEEPPIERLGILKDIEDAPTLDALLALILLKLVQQRMRIGLGRNYSKEEHLLRGIRGRINFTDSVKYHTFEHGQVYCNFEEFSLNVPKNQIIRSTLMRLIRIGNFGPDVNKANELRQNLRWATRAMESVNLIDLKLDFIRRQQLGRNDGDYKLMLSICELLLKRQMPTHATGQNQITSLEQASLIMHYIYESFIANFYRIHLQGWRVYKQKYIYWYEKTHNQYLPSMQPDLMLEEKATGRIIILDTKFTANSLISNQWGGNVFDSSHLYQVYAYLKTQERLSEQHRLASGILLYPSVNTTQFSEKIELGEQTIRIQTVDLTAPWQCIEYSLMNIIAS